MSGAGKRFNFHGTYASKKDAIRKERDVPGSFILPVKVGGSTHYAVVTPRK